MYYCKLLLVITHLDMNNIFTPKTKIYIGLVSAGIFSKLYYDNSKHIEQLPTQKIYNYPTDLDTILHTFNPMKSESFSIKINSNIVNSDPNHLFRVIKLFEKQCFRVENDSLIDIFTEYTDSDISDNFTHVQDIPSKLSCVETQFKNHKIVSSQREFLPYVNIGEHTIGTDSKFEYFGANIYSNAPIKVLKTKYEIKNLFMDAGHPQIAHKFIHRCKILSPESSVIAYTQIIDSPTIFMNVVRSFDTNSMPVFNVQIITDNEETLIQKTMEKYDKRTLYGSVVFFSLCVVVRNLLPF